MINLTPFLAKNVDLIQKLENEDFLNPHFVNAYAFYNKDYIKLSTSQATNYKTIYQLN
jgi:hypothetical protein